jgi:glutathione S-transferase
MIAPEISRYRGYDIVPKRQWSSWCVGIYPTRADLPILPRSTLSALATRKADAVAEAKQAIDRILSRLDNAAEDGRPWLLP